MAELTRIERLSGYLSQAGHRPFAWGSWDCCVFVAEWVGREHGVDALGDLRGAYGSQEEAEAIIAARGGLEALLDSVTAGLGLRRTSDPQPGDLGLVMSQDVVAAAIHGLRGRWVALTPTGLAGWRLPVLAAWSV